MFKSSMLHDGCRRSDVLEGANELRIMLCRDKMVQSGGGWKRSTAIIAACGAGGGRVGIPSPPLPQHAHCMHACMHGHTHTPAHVQMHTLSLHIHTSSSLYFSLDASPVVKHQRTQLCPQH
jgi:hypothetical protein